MSLALDQKAIEILKQNDRGGFTIPTARLYPYQWNWDSAFVALGIATYDWERAWQELDKLVEGQWECGMIPHIIFRRHDPDYFPGPNVWQATTNGIPTGGISQPPVFASVVHTLLQAGYAEDKARAKTLFDPLMKWHRWFYEQRKPEGCPAVCTIHPWETGRDNCPDWNIGLGNMTIDPELEAYQRQDILHADPAERPSQEQYDKYVTIIKYGRDHGWDQAKITNDGPFLMADPGIHFILLRANRDLLKIADYIGRQETKDEIQTWIDDGVKATEYFWNDQLKAFCARDVRSGEMSMGFSSASALCFYADAGSEDQRQGTLDNMQRIAQKVNYMQPSWDPDTVGFEPARYWCGPAWPQMNHIISKGLAEQGHHDMALKIKHDYQALIEKSGFFECFNPVTGAGCIGRDFSWTAALWLSWASPTCQPHLKRAG